MLREATNKLYQVKANFTPVGISGAHGVPATAVAADAALLIYSHRPAGAAAACPRCPPTLRPLPCTQHTARNPLPLFPHPAAMEDFIGRGDRRIGAVIKRAWELGATNDAWWQSEETAFKAWSQAIAGERRFGWGKQPCQLFVLLAFLLQPLLRGLGIVPPWH